MRANVVVDVVGMAQRGDGAWPRPTASVGGQFGPARVERHCGPSSTRGAVLFEPTVLEMVTQYRGRSPVPRRSTFREIATPSRRWWANHRATAASNSSY